MAIKNKLIGGLVACSILVCSLALPVAATDDATTTDPTLASLLAIIESLKQQIAELETRIVALQAAKQAVKEAKEEVKAGIQEILQLSRQLWEGARGEDVTLLQEFLATDPEIYPEGLITGYFGPLTKAAVKRFQKKMGVEQAGVVGPKTTSKINELLTEGAGQSGKVPPGLLIAPGIRKKIGYTPTPPAGQILPPGIAKKISTTTPQEPEEPDETAPVISDVQAENITETAADITWTTDEAADSLVYYSTTSPVVATSSTPNVSDASLVTGHSVALTGLSASTTYYYMVVSADEAGNSATSSELWFTTSATTPPDQTAPVISDVSVSSVTSTEAQITWTTDEASDSTVYYATTTPVDTATSYSSTNINLVLNHSISLVDLSASTTYYYLVASSDASGNTATSSESSFTTTAGE